MNRFFHFWAFVLVPLALTACQHTAMNTAPAEPAFQRVGADRDAHGCIPSAGYVWSDVQTRCLRLFEDGLALRPYADNPQPNLYAYLVLSQSDVSAQKAELFLPGNSSAIMLTVLKPAEGDVRPLLMENKPNEIEVIRAKDDLFVRIKGKLWFVRSL